jgi:hypothetical protein
LRANAAGGANLAGSAGSAGSARGSGRTCWAYEALGTSRACGARIALRPLRSSRTHLPRRSRRPDVIPLVVIPEVEKARRRGLDKPGVTSIAELGEIVDLRHRALDLEYPVADRASNGDVSRPHDRGS